MARKRKLRGVEKARKLVRGYQAGGKVNSLFTPGEQAFLTLPGHENLPFRFREGTEALPGSMALSDPGVLGITGGIDPLEFLKSSPVTPSGLNFSQARVSPGGPLGPKAFTISAPIAMPTRVSAPRKVAEFVNIPPEEQLTASPFRSAVSGAIDPGGNIAQLGALLTGVENPNALAAVGLLGGLIFPSPTDDIAKISKVLTKKGVGSLSELASEKGLTNIKLSSGAELKLGRGNLFIETPKGGTAFAQEAVEKLPGAGEFAALKLGTIEAPGEAKKAFEALDVA